MRYFLVIGLVSFLAVSAAGQTRNNMLYTSFLKFPNSSYDVSLGWDHATKLTRRNWTSGRLYFILSPNVLWSGYNFNNLKEQEYPKTKFEQYQLVLPLHLRFELTPNRIVLGKRPGKHDNDVAIFFDAGISLNYILSAHLHEDFSQVAGNSFPYVFDGAITSSIANRFNANYLTINVGLRFHRVTYFIRAYQPFSKTRYADLSKNWGLPAGTRSFFYNDWQTNSYYQQGTVTLCLGYYF